MFINGGTIDFDGVASAGSGTFTTGGSNSGEFGGAIVFYSGSADHGMFTVNGGAVVGARRGDMLFVDTATAGNGNFTVNGGAVPGSTGGRLSFISTTTAADGTFVVNGSPDPAGSAGSIDFSESSTAGNATLIAKGNGNGGSIFFNAGSSGGTAHISLFGEGTLLVDSHLAFDLTIGSLEGEDTSDVILGARTLIVGSDNRSTLFSGMISDSNMGGALTKIGSGVLTLAGQNTYTGLTTVSAGALCVYGSVAGSVLITNGANLCLDGGTLGQPSSSITIYSGGRLVGVGTVNGNVSNDGLISSDGAGLMVFTGNLINSGTIRFSKGASLDAEEPLRS